MFFFCRHQAHVAPGGPAHFWSYCQISFLQLRATCPQGLTAVNTMRANSTGGWAELVGAWTDITSWKPADPVCPRLIRNYSKFTKWKFEKFQVFSGLLNSIICKGIKLNLGPGMNSRSGWRTPPKDTRRYKFCTQFISPAEQSEIYKISLPFLKSKQFLYEPCVGNHADGCE